MKNKKLKRAGISSLEVEELACYLTGLDYDEIDADEGVIDEKLQEKFFISLEIFSDLVDLLLPLIEVGEGLYGAYAGFADKEKKMWFTKMKISDQ